jgi:hypothetical protein
LNKADVAIPPNASALQGFSIVVEFATVKASEFNKDQQPQKKQWREPFDSIGRGGQIRTDDPLLPKQVTPFMEIC